jgi:hypothetical protein
MRVGDEGVDLRPLESVVEGQPLGEPTDRWKRMLKPKD